MTFEGIRIWTHTPSVRWKSDAAGISRPAEAIVTCTGESAAERLLHELRRGINVFSMEEKNDRCKISACGDDPYFEAEFSARGRPNRMGRISRARVVRDPPAVNGKKHARSRARSGCQKNHGELERAEALSNFQSCPAACTAGRLLALTGKQVASRPAKRNRRFRFAAAAGDFCGGKSHFPEQKSIPCRFCARGFRRNPSKIWRRLKTQRVFRFRQRRNCRRQNQRF